MKRIDKSKIIYIHIPIYQEILEKNYDKNKSFLKYKDELLELTKSSNIIHVDLLDSIKINPNEAKKIPVSQDNQHPSEYGLEFYAEKFLKF